MGFLDKLFGRSASDGPVTRRREVSADTYPGTVMEYFDMLLEKHFPELQAEMMVYPRDLDIRASFESYPITFLLRRERKPVLALLLLDRDRSDTPAIRNTLQTCEDNGIPCLRFFNQDRSEASEVIQAIREKLQ